MNAATPQIRDLATRLIAFEAARGEPAAAGGAGRVCETISVPLS